jgi:hypothetical protein
MADIHKFTSRYRGTPIKDFYLDLWTEIEIPESPNDLLIEVDPKYDERPDLLSFDLYGTPRLWWVFAIRNPDTLIDPINDFRSGILIFAPTRDAVERLPSLS